MSKALTVISSNVPSPDMAAKLHQCVINAGAISAASAVLCGLELLAVKKALKPTGVGFLQWFEKNASHLGFSKSTKDNYMKAAVETKAKLLKTGGKATLALLEAAPASLSKADREKLLNSVRKCIGVQTLMEIYLEAGIVKSSHKSPKPLLGNGENSSPGPRHSDEQELVQNGFYMPFSQLFGFAEKSIKRGKDSISALAIIPKDRWLSHRAELQQILDKGDAIHGVKK